MVLVRERFCSTLHISRERRGGTCTRTYYTYTLYRGWQVDGVVGTSLEVFGSRRTCNTVVVDVVYSGIAPEPAGGNAERKTECSGEDGHGDRESEINGKILFKKTTSPLWTKQIKEREKKRVCVLLRDGMKIGVECVVWKRSSSGSFAPRVHHKTWRLSSPVLLLAVCAR